MHYDFHERPTQQHFGDMLMKLIRLLILLCLPAGAVAQGLPYTPPAVAAYVNGGSGWIPDANAAAFGALPFVPQQKVAMYCQASAGAAWSPCLPGGGGTPFDPASPGPIGGTTPDAITGTTVTATQFLVAPNGNNNFPGFQFSSDPSTGLTGGVGAGNITMYNGGVKAHDWSAVRYVMGAPVVIQWANGSDVTTGAVDTGLSHTAAGALALGNGTAGDVTGSFTTRNVNAETHSTTLGTPIASAGNIAPFTGVTHVTGTAAIVTITPPFTGFIGSLTLIADAAWTTTTAGNIEAAMTAIANTPYVATFDGTKWYIK